MGGLGVGALRRLASEHGVPQKHGGHVWSKVELAVVGNALETKDTGRGSTTKATISKMRRGSWPVGLHPRHMSQPRMGYLIHERLKVLRREALLFGLRKFGQVIGFGVHPCALMRKVDVVCGSHIQRHARKPPASPSPLLRPRVQTNLPTPARTLVPLMRDTSCSVSRSLMRASLLILATAAWKRFQHHR